MTATNSVEAAKDGTGAAFNVTFATESGSGNKAQKTYLGSPSTESLVEPMTLTGGTVGLVAGTAQIGSVQGTAVAVVVTPTVTAGSYTAGYIMGGVMTFANILPATNFDAVLNTITLRFKGTVQTTEFDVAIFTASPAGTFTDHAAPVIAAADTALLLGIYPMTVNQSNLGTHTVYSLDKIGKPIVGTTTSLFLVITTKGVPVAPASASDMSVILGVNW